MINNSSIEECSYSIYASAEVMLIKHPDYEKLVLLELLGTNIFEIDDDIMSTLSFVDMRKAHAIIGVFQIQQFNVLFYVSFAECLGVLKSSKIFRVKEVDYIPICNKGLFENCDQEIKDILQGIKSYLTIGFYYSFNYDLTNNYSWQNDKDKDNNLVTTSPNIEYYWNYTISKPFLDNKINPKFLVKLICGYVGFSNTIELYGTKIVLALISRRSTNMPGTSHNCKGIDEFGNAANFVESEQILQSDKKTFSFVIYRGCPFVFYKKKPSESGLKLVDKPNSEKIESAITKHIESITQRSKYNIFILNLLSEHSHTESEINQQVKAEHFPINTSTDGIVQNLNYDCKNEIERQEFADLEFFINTLLENDNFMNTIQYSLDDNGKKCIMQKGVFRVNCLNSLDRTNIIQTAICWKIIEDLVFIFLIKFTFLGFDTISLFGKYYINTKQKSLHPILNTFKTLWTHNGENLSLQYFGYLSEKDKANKRSFFNIFSESYSEENFRNEVIYRFLKKNYNSKF